MLGGALEFGERRDRGTGLSRLLVIHFEQDGLVALDDQRTVRHRSSTLLRSLFGTGFTVGEATDTEPPERSAGSRLRRRRHRGDAVHGELPGPALGGIPCQELSAGHRQGTYQSLGGHTRVIDVADQDVPTVFGGL